jgi:hypothetical protein
LFKFTVSPDGAESFECEATSRDIVRWEGMGKGRTMGALVDNMRMTDLTDLAYVATQRLGLYDGDVREFRACVDIEVEKKDDEFSDLGPTNAAR